MRCIRIYTRWKCSHHWGFIVSAAPNAHARLPSFSPSAASSVGHYIVNLAAVSIATDYDGSSSCGEQMTSKPSGHACMHAESTHLLHDVA